MSLVLFGVGLLVIAAGFLTIGFGIPINAFSLGNTLIVAGTVAVVGGLVTLGLAACIRQLNRIAEALTSRPLARPAAATAVAVPAPAAAESFAPPVARIPPAPPQPAPVPPPAPPRQVMPTATPTAMPKPPEPAAPRPPEPRFPAGGGETRGPLDWLRSKPKAGDAPPLAADQPDPAEEAPLSPRPPQRTAFPPPPVADDGPSAPPAGEPKSWMRSRDSAPEPQVEDEPKFDMPPRQETVARATPPERNREAEPAKPAAKDAGKDAGLFDVVWPDARSKPMPSPNREPEHRFEAPQRAPEVRAERRAEPSQDRVAILKSGVIDGMAYTLYADGSIEAELPQGTVRFASVDALRAHLEKSA